jgi:hypothetical protein
MAGPARPAAPVLVAVTDHAVERFRQRVGSRSGELDPRGEIAARVSRAWAAGRVSDQPPAGAAAQRGSVYVRDLVDRDVTFVCLHDRPRGELVVITLWEAGRLGEPRAPRRFTDELRERRPRERGR